MKKAGYQIEMSIKAGSLWRYTPCPAFSMTSQLRHHYVVSCKYWWDILQFLSHTDCQDDSCQKLWKVVKICRSHGQNTTCLFFSGHTVHITHNSAINRERRERERQTDRQTDKQTHINTANRSAVCWITTVTESQKL